MTLLESDARLVANGYEPIVVVGKHPVAAEWQKRPNTVEALAAERAAHPHAVSTGLRTGRLAGIDIDIRPIFGAPEGYTGWMDHTYAIEDLAADVLCHTDMKRVGSKGAMLVYRNETPIRKITIQGEHPTLTQHDHHKAASANWAEPLKAKIEILGTGQQFVAYGAHPDTGKPYGWPLSSLTDAEPRLRPYADLVEVTPDTLREFAQRAAALLRDLGYEKVSVSNPGDPANRKPAVAPEGVEEDPEDIEEWAITLIDAVIEHDGSAVVGNSLNDRTFALAARLKDGPQYGYTVSEDLAVELIREHWSDADRVEQTVRNAYSDSGQNAPGCGQAGSASRKYDPALGIREFAVEDAIKALAEPADSMGEAWGAPLPLKTTVGRSCSMAESWTMSAFREIGFHTARATEKKPSLSERSYPAGLRST